MSSENKSSSEAGIELPEPDEAEDRSVTTARANVLALVYGGLPALVFVVLHHVLRGDIDWLGAYHSLPVFLSGNRSRVHGRLNRWASTRS